MDFCFFAIIQETDCINPANSCFFHALIGTEGFEIMFAQKCFCRLLHLFPVQWLFAPKGVLPQKNRRLFAVPDGIDICFGFGVQAAVETRRHLRNGKARDILRQAAVERRKQFFRRTLPVDMEIGCLPCGVRSRICPP